MKIISNTSKLYFRNPQFLSSVYQLSGEQIITIPVTDVLPTDTYIIEFDKGAKFNDYMSSFTNKARSLLFGENDYGTKSVLRIKIWGTNTEPPAGDRISVQQNGLSYNSDPAIEIADLNDKNNIIRIEYNDGVGSGKLYINGVEKATSFGYYPTTGANISALVLFKDNEYYDLLKVKELKVLRGSTVLHDYKPVLYNNEAYLLDMVTSSMYKANTGELGYD
jgi:hypothetical protein